MVNKARKQIDFNSQELANKMMEEAYKVLPRWFDNVSEGVLDDFAMKYATKRWNVSPTGNPSAIVVSYPRPNGKVKVYDLDSGDMFWVKLSLFTQARVSGRAEEQDYEYSSVVMDDQRCESEDMTLRIDWESLKEFDKAKTKAERRVLGGERVQKLIALPKRKS
jgi:hypothetical protein